MSNLSRLPFLQIVTLLITSNTALAATTTCDLFPTETCSSGTLVDVDIYGDQAVATATMGTTYKRMDVFATVCDPTGWWLHLADSPGDDGYGGDGGQANHDAEAYLYDGYDLHIYGTYDSSRLNTPETLTVSNALDLDDMPTGCTNVQLAFINGSTKTQPSKVHWDADPDLTVASPSVVNWSSLRGPRLGYTASTSSTSVKNGIELDYEDSALADRYKWYIGINRMVDSLGSTSSRDGGGVSYACVVLSTTTTEPSSCL